MLKEKKSGYLISAIAMATIIAPLAFYFVNRGHQIGSIIFGLFALFIWGTLYFCLALTDLIAVIQAKITTNKHLIIPITLSLGIPWIIYAMGTSQWQMEAWLGMFAYIVVPLLIVYHAKTGCDRLQVRDVLFISAIFLPIDLGIIQKYFIWPENLGGAAYSHIFGVILLLFLMCGYRGLDGVGFEFKISRIDIPLILRNFGLFIIVALPFGFTTGFISFFPKPIDPIHIIANFVGILLVVAVPEELLFRGIIQNLLQRTLNKPKVALVLAAFIFSLAHYNNSGVAHGPAPDYRYLILAFIAGIFYGHAYQKSQNLYPAILVHTLIDVVWLSFFKI